MTTTTTTPDTRTRATPADVRRLIEANPGLIRWAARRASDRTRGRLAFDEAVSEVALFALKYARRFDPARFKFSTWLAQLARAVAGRFHARHTCQCRDGRREVRGLDFARLAAGAPDPAALPDEPDPDVLRLRAALARFPARDRHALTLRFGLDGRGERRLAAIDPAVTQERTRQVIAAGLRRLRTALREGGRP